MAAKKLQKLLHMFEKDDTVAVIIVPDPDAIASAMAFSAIVSSHVKRIETVFVRETRRPDNRTMLSLFHVKYKMLQDVDLNVYTKKVMLDGQPSHSHLTESVDFSVVIDHHPPAESSKRVPFTDIRPLHSANSTIMVEYLEEMYQGKISSKLATALYYGILTDTDYFVRVKDSKYVSAVCTLLPKVNMGIIRTIESSELCRRHIKYFIEGLNSIIFRESSAFVYMEKVADKDFLSVMSDFLMRVRGVDMDVVSCVSEDTLILAFRSWTDRFNVGEIAGKLSSYGEGGGHRFAGRAEIPLSQIPDMYKPLSSDSIIGFLRDVIGGHILAPQSERPCSLKNFCKNPEEECS